MVLLMNLHDAGQSVAGRAIASLAVGVCPDTVYVKRFRQAYFFVLFYMVHLTLLGILLVRRGMK
ncbi:TPA: hypothetical protein PGG59_005232 [Raoultella planticola]|nr:hypothetical protein [Raoultella planticola]